MRCTNTETLSLLWKFKCRTFGFQFILHRIHRFGILYIPFVGRLILLVCFCLSSEHLEVVNRGKKRKFKSCWKSNRNQMYRSEAKPNQVTIPTNLHSIIFMYGECFTFRCIIISAWIDLAKNEMGRHTHTHALAKSRVQ